MTSSRVPQSDYMYMIKMTYQEQREDESRTGRALNNLAAVLPSLATGAANKDQQALLLLNWWFSWGLHILGGKNPMWLRRQK